MVEENVKDEVVEENGAEIESTDDATSDSSEEPESWGIDSYQSDITSIS